MHDHKMAPILTLFLSVLASSFVVSLSDHSISRLDFPDGFIFGTASSAFQVQYLCVCVFVCYFLIIGYD